MNKYRELLALSYFKEYGKNYAFSKLRKILGLDMQSFDDLISSMMENELLQYKEYILEITDKGLKELTYNDMLHYRESDTEYHYLNVDFENRLGLDEIYIPMDIEKI